MEPIKTVFLNKTFSDHCRVTGLSVFEFFASFFEMLSGVSIVTMKYNLL